MNNLVLITVIRAVILIALQVLVFSRIGMEQAWGAYVQPLLYPLIILLLPVGIPTVALLGVAFLVGTIIDVSLGTYGVHAGALVLLAFARSLLLVLVEPREGFSIGQSPTLRVLGAAPFAGYLALGLLVNAFAYFSLEIFTFVYFGQILLRSLASFAISFVLIYGYMVVIDPKV